VYCLLCKALGDSHVLLLRLVCVCVCVCVCASVEVGMYTGIVLKLVWK